MRYTRRHTEPNLPTDASLIEILTRKTVERKRERNEYAECIKRNAKMYGALWRATAYGLPAREIFAAIQ